MSLARNCKQFQLFHCVFFLSHVLVVRFLLFLCWYWDYWVFCFYLFWTFRYPSEKSLNIHRELHNPTDTAVCEQCGKLLLTRNALAMHMKAVHLPKAPRTRQQCKYCQAWLASKSGLRTHILNMHVHADVEHRCEICGFVSTSREAKKRHIQFKHNPEKRHKCSVCDKSFKVAILLRVSCAEVFSVVFYVVIQSPLFISQGTHGHPYRCWSVQVSVLWCHIQIEIESFDPFKTCPSRRVWKSHYKTTQAVWH